MSFFSTYSFDQTYCSINGPGGSFQIGGPDTGTAEEGITIVYGEEHNTQMIGADGSVMNSKHAARSGTCTVRLMKNSPANGALNAMGVLQHLNAANWGINTITLQDNLRGDSYTLSGVAFKRITPSNAYGKLGNVLEWEFDVAKVSPLLGTGTVNTATA